MSDVTRIEGIIPINAPDLGRRINGQVKIDTVDGKVYVEAVGSEMAKTLAIELARGGLFLEFRSTTPPR